MPEFLIPGTENDAPLKAGVKIDVASSIKRKPTVRRKPLPASAESSLRKHSDTHPVTRHGERRQQMVLAPSPKTSIYERNSRDEDALSAPVSPFIYGDQLFPRVPYFEEKDSELWRNDGDTVICVGRNVELRIDSSTILSCKYRSLIDKLQELNESDSADFTAAAPFGEVPIRYIIELPEPIRSDPKRYCVSVRNFFAALRGKPIAGEDLVSELDQLHWTAVDLFGVQEHRDIAKKFVRGYVQSLRLDDCRSMLSEAIRLLAWCERTKWEKGWIECFAHCVGMMDHDMEEYDSFSELSERTRKLLYRSFRKQQEGVFALQQILTDFSFAGSTSTVDLEHAAGLRSARLFEKFLKSYYTTKFGGVWPPPADASGRWLTRNIVQTLQEDLGGLYDMLVNDSVIQYMEGAIPYLLHINEDETLTPLEPSSHASQFPLQKIVSSWNFRCGFTPIPHPWPLLPTLRDTSPVRDASPANDSLVPALRERSADSVQDRHDLHNAYCQGTNAYSHSSHFVLAFLDHEATTRLKGVNTHDARLGRWLVIHCMLQMLARIAVDIQGLWYTTGVPYFLNCDLEDCPPWAGAKPPRTIRPAHFEDSWCWLHARGVADARHTTNAGGERRKPRPHYHVHWDQEGRWELEPIG
ncbi:hypothetical protein AAFC00_000555 [Neodothiora populina]|uniref:DUF8004 domain-containing protein n=1 Tax=Neodothiora populina TaxID=2781224 RepID=A0ABR3PDC4_9PEZI